MNILVTGANGFIGKNLCLRLAESGFTHITKIDRDSTEEQLKSALLDADFIFHLAGVNRPLNQNEFVQGNSDFTKEILSFLKENNKKTPFMLSSSSQVKIDNPYGKSKLDAEGWVENYSLETGADYYIYRFPNVFGKWCKPNYNSFIATFCHNISNNIDITVNDPDVKVSLIYIDDLCSDLINLLKMQTSSGLKSVSPVYIKTVGEVAELLYSFRDSRKSLITDKVGTGFIRALYSTWLSYLQPEQFSYTVPAYSDPRGTFCEMLKTPETGQMSYFTAHPGVTRGGHYHHTKNEKFLVIKGTARFKFENVITGDVYQLDITESEFKIVETVPGWSHDVTNIGDDELIVMLWANEVFDRQAPDTISRLLK